MFQGCRTLPSFRLGVSGHGPQPKWKRPPTSPRSGSRRAAAESKVSPYSAGGRRSGSGEGERGRPRDVEATAPKDHGGAATEGRGRRRRETESLKVRPPAVEASPKLARARLCGRSGGGSDSALGQSTKVEKAEDGAGGAGGAGLARKGL